jgi:TetR/AcrR family transcriptional repressor of nem operon
MTTPTARERLLDATAQQLWEKGYAATSPADIQRAAGVGQGSMYHHFAGKPDLARAAIERLASDLERETQTALADRAPLERALAYLDREREPLRGCRVGRLLADADVVEDPLLREPVAGTLARVQSELADALREAQRDGTLDPALEPDELAATLAAVVQGGYVLARAEQDPAPFDRAIAGARALLTHAAPR